MSARRCERCGRPVDPLASPLAPCAWCNRQALAREILGDRHDVPEGMNVAIRRTTINEIDAPACDECGAIMVRTTDDNLVCINCGRLGGEYLGQHLVRTDSEVTLSPRVVNVKERTSEIAWVKTNEHWERALPHIFHSDNPYHILGLSVVPDHSNEDATQDRNQLALLISDRTVFRAPIGALKQRWINFASIDNYFSTRALWKVAEELAAQVKTEASKENLRAVKAYIEGVRNEYAAFVLTMSSMQVPVVVGVRQHVRFHVLSEDGQIIGEPGLVKEGVPVYTVELALLLTR